MRLCVRHDKAWTKHGQLIRAVLRCWSDWRNILWVSLTCRVLAVKKRQWIFSRQSSKSGDSRCMSMYVILAHFNNVSNKCFFGFTSFVSVLWWPRKLGININESYTIHAIDCNICNHKPHALIVWDSILQALTTHKTPPTSLAVEECKEHQRSVLSRLPIPPLVTPSKSRPCSLWMQFSWSHWLRPGHFWKPTLSTKIDRRVHHSSIDFWIERRTSSWW